jgi:hypothetical protein
MFVISGNYFFVSSSFTSPLIDGKPPTKTPEQHNLVQSRLVGKASDLVEIFEWENAGNSRVRWKLRENLENLASFKRVDVYTVTSVPRNQVGLEKISKQFPPDFLAYQIQFSPRLFGKIVLNFGCKQEESFRSFKPTLYTLKTISLSSHFLFIDLKCPNKNGKFRIISIIAKMKKFPV